MSRSASLLIGLLLLAVGQPMLAQFGPTLLEATHDGANHDGVVDSLEIVFDPLRPEPSIVTPPADRVLGSTRISVTGTVGDEDEFLPFGGGGIFGEVLYQVEDEFGVLLETGTAPLANGRFTIPEVNLGIGRHFIFVRAIDAAGNVGVDGTFVTVDPQPEVNLVGVTDGQVVSASSITIGLDFAAETTIVNANFSPDGRTFPPGPAPDLFELPLQLGENRFFFTFDAGGGVYGIWFTLFRVASLDPPRITSIDDGGFTSQETLTVTGTVPVGTQFVEVNGVEATIDASGAFTADVPLQEGTNTIAATSYPQADTTRIEVTRDTRPPRLLKLFPGNGTATLDTELPIGASFDEPAEVEVIGPADSVSGGTRSVVVGFVLGAPAVEHLAELDPLALAAGPNELVLTARDRAGNETVVTFEVLQAETALLLTHPPDGSEIADLRVSPIVEALADLTIDALYVGGQRIPSFEGGTLGAGPGIQLPPIPLSPGPNEIRVVYHREGSSGEVTTFHFESTATDAMTVTGQVTDRETGEAVGGALVSVTVNGLRRIVVTDADGRYEVETEAGTATVVAMSEGYLADSTSGSGGPGDTVVADLPLGSSGLPGLVNELAIAVPPDGTVTDFEKVTVVGTVLNPTSVVAVNGVQAEVVGHRFTARGVPLAMGANTVEATASALGSPAVTASVEVERAAEPVLDVKLFSPPAGATVPGGGLVVRGFVSAREPLTRLGEVGFVSVEEGVFQANDVFLAPGSQRLRLESLLRDETQSAADEIELSVAALDPALVLSADPASGTPPLDVALSLAFGIEPFAVERIDFDVDGDGALDIVGGPAEVAASYGEASPVLARAFATTPGGVELSAPVRVGVHLPSLVLREFAAGSPVDLAPGPGDSLYVLDAAESSVSRYSLDGVLEASFGSGGAGADQLLDPRALAVGPAGRIFVADTGNDRVQVFSAAGAFEGTIGAGGSAPGQLAAPRGIAVVDRQLVVADTGNARIQVFTLEGEPVESIPLAQPRGIFDVSGLGAAIASPVAGLLSLVDGRLGSVQALAALPPSVGALAPVDIAAGTDAVLLADAGGSRVLVLTPRLGFRRSIEGLERAPLAVLPSLRREVESLYVADGTKVVEIGLPVVSPLPVVQSLKSRLAAGDIPGALELIHPLQRDLFEEIYTDIAPDLPGDAAAMTDFEVDRLREGAAIVRIRSVGDNGGVVSERRFPVYLVRSEDGSWLIFDY